MTEASPSPTPPEPARNPLATARRNDAAKATYLQGLAEMRAGALKAAKALRELDRDAHFVFEGCASLAEFGERNGSSAWETRQLSGLAFAVEANPVVEAKFREGRLPLPSAALLGRVLTDPGMVRAGEDWIGWAESESARSFRRRVSRRVEEVRHGDQPVVMITLYLTAKARHEFERACAIASRRAQRALTESEGLEHVVDHYLATYDPQRKRGAARRMPHTSQAPGRTVPAQVRREVAKRTDDRCAVPYCDHRVFLQDAHIVPHARGGDREAGNLVRLCSRHHKMFDEGRLRMEGTAENPRFFAEDGRPLEERRTDPPESARDPPPSD